MKNKKHAFIYLAAIVLIIVFVVLYIIKGKDNVYAHDAATLSAGKNIFITQCSSCHSLTENSFGPRLGAVTTILSREYLLSFIENPSKVIATGDKRANVLYRNTKMMMPSFETLKEDEIISVLAYIDNESEETGIGPLKVDTTAVPAGNKVKERLVPAVKESGLVIELKDFIKIARGDSNPPDKGVATLRADPAGDGTIFISDQIGIIYRIENGTADTFLDVKALIPDFAFTPGIGTGLGSFAFHPGYLHNGLIYTTHAELYKGKPTDFQFADTFKAGLQWVISEWKMNDIKAHRFNGTRRELLRINTPTTAHGAQDLAFAPTADRSNAHYGMLFMGIGDGGSNNIKRPDLVHNKQSLLGTVIRIDPRGNNSKNRHYGIPPDNPFANDKDPTVRKEIWAYGFRNPHRMAWDMKDHARMLIADIGESNIEEINIIEKGTDYGWPVREGDFRIATKEDLTKVYPLNAAERSVYHAPFAVYDHVDGNAISGGFVYDGSLLPLKNKYIFGDIVNGKLFYVNIDRQLSDSSIYELSIIENGEPTDLRKLNNEKRIHLRIGYDAAKKEL
ncbi:MAG: PQQ-dependent sugar dehydrogenase, partial [Ginsengibacter sp.]